MMIKTPEKLGCNFYRSTLSSQGQIFYDRINSQLLRGDYSGVTSFQIVNTEQAASDCFAAYDALRDDHPEYFFLGFHNEFTYYINSGSLKYPILYSAENIGRIKQQMRKTVCRLVQGTANLATVEREMLVYKRIAEKLDYTDNDDMRDHSIVGPVLLSSGVCEGYNALLLLCFRRIGIPCIKIYGKAKASEWHCWTIAWIEGMPTHCDVTWDTMEDGMVCFNYFNLSDKQIKSDHKSFRCAHIPICKSEDLNYYSYRHRSVSSFEGLRACLREDYSDGVSPILIHFDYTPEAKVYHNEVQKAFDAEGIGSKHKVYYCPKKKNIAVKIL